MKWRTGLILQYGNLTLLSISELAEGMFPGVDQSKGIMVFAEEQWQEHKSSKKIFGINIMTPDLYPILKFPEARNKYQRVNHRGHSPGSRSAEQGGASDGNHTHGIVDIHVERPGEGVRSCDAHVTNRMVSIDQIDSEFEKLMKTRQSMSRTSSQGEGSGSGMGVVSEAVNGRMSPAPVRGRNGGLQHPARPADR